jgi:hypothetical protein
MLWCGACSEQDYRDTTFYEPPHDLGHSGVLSSCATAPLDDECPEPADEWFVNAKHHKLGCDISG